MQILGANARTIRYHYAEHVQKGKLILGNNVRWTKGLVPGKTPEVMQIARGAPTLDKCVLRFPSLSPRGIHSVDPSELAHGVSFHIQLCKSGLRHPSCKGYCFDPGLMQMAQGAPTPLENLRRRFEFIEAGTGVRVLTAGYERYASACRIHMFKPLPCGFENHSLGGMFFDRTAGI